MTLGPAPPSLPTLSLSDPIRDVLVGALGLAALSKPHSICGGSVRARFRHAARKEYKNDRNVLGFFPGSDPEKKKEVIIFSAHYDHVGVDDKGEIYNGSDDNASGTSSLLEIAEAFGQCPKPARSVAFLWVSGEEKGLLGSEWFANHPSLPADARIVADINLDMVSRNDPKKIGITPSPWHGQYNSLIPAAAACIACERPISDPSGQTAALFDMFCALNGATRTPRPAKIRQRAAVSRLLPTDELAPWIMRVRAVIAGLPPHAREDLQLRQAVTNRDASSGRPSKCRCTYEAQRFRSHAPSGLSVTSPPPPASSRAAGRPAGRSIHDE